MYKLGLCFVVYAEGMYKLGIPYFSILISHQNCLINYWSDHGLLYLLDVLFQFFCLLVYEEFIKNFVVYLNCFAWVSCGAFVYLVVSVWLVTLLVVK